METVKTFTNDSIRRLHSYLRCVGIDDGDAINLLTEMIIILVDQSENSKNFEDAIIDKAIRHKEDWISFLNNYTSDGNPDWANPLVGWHLRSIVCQQPELLLREPDIDDFRIIDKPANMCADPPICESDMPSQPLGEMPVALQKKFWQTVFGGIITIWQKLMTCIWEE